MHSSTRPSGLHAEMVSIASGLRCPVCEDLSVARSDAPEAVGMRKEILARLREGESASEIRAYFVSRYGKFILLSPPRRGVALWIWILPVVGVVAAVGGVFTVVAVRRKAAFSKRDGMAVSMEELEKIAAQLPRMKGTQLSKPSESSDPDHEPYRTL
ncbi:MAG: cytochrome c-type biogenesis protein CcmH [Actinobacteria bacterium]|nr:cytochrome c-type biogenesis protein CcmH [Actinomycetota bacterium]